MTSHSLTSHSGTIVLVECASFASVTRANACSVLEHQVLVHNRLTKANFATRQALHFEALLNQSAGDAPSPRLDSTTRRIQSAGDDLVEALLMVDEAKLTAAIEGTSGFAKMFSARGPRDSSGRSLRDRELQRRMFKHPCSYLIYSPAFDNLPADMRDYVWRRLWQVLVVGQDAAKFAHLSADDKRAIVEILVETKPGLPDYWQDQAARQGDPATVDAVPAAHEPLS